MCQMGCTDASLKGTVDTVVFTVQGFLPTERQPYGGGGIRQDKKKNALNVYIVGSSITISIQNNSFALEGDSKLAPGF